MKKDPEIRYPLIFGKSHVEAQESLAFGRAAGGGSRVQTPALTPSTSQLQDMLLDSE